jgi:hypothetical protein
MKITSGDMQVRVLYPNVVPIQTLIDFLKNVGTLLSGRSSKEIGSAPYAIETAIIDEGEYGGLEAKVREAHESSIAAI